LFLAIKNFINNKTCDKIIDKNLEVFSMVKVLIYSSPDCPYCYLVKDYLTKKDIQFEEIDLYEQPEKRKEMEEISGQKNIPVILINNEVVNGWKKEKIDKLLEKYGAV